MADDKYPSLQVMVPVEVVDAMDKLVATIPQQNYSMIGEAAIRAWLEGVEAQDFELIHPTRRTTFTKGAGAPFPRRLHDKIRGRINTTRRREGRTRQNTRSLRLYLPDDLIQSFKDAVYWMCETRAYVVEDALRADLGLEAWDAGGGEA